MDHFLSDAKRLVQRLQNHDNAVDILISETINLQNKLIAMRQYRDEVNQMNQAANHRARSTLILGSQLENQRIQNLEQENRELSISLAEHQSALELIMNKYREQVLVMMKANGTETAVQSSCQPTHSEIAMSEKIAEMAYVMRQSASIDESVAAKEIEALRSLQVENDNLRELLEISGKHFTYSKTHNGTLPVQNGLDTITKQSTDDVDNKDSGIYDEDTSQNVSSDNDVLFQKGVKITDYKPRRIKSKSKHVNNLQNLFLNPSVKETNDSSITSTNDNIEQDSEDHSYKLYTIERFIPNDEVGNILPNTEPEKPLNNSDLPDIFQKNQASPFGEIPDVGSEISQCHEEGNNMDFKETFSNHLSKEGENTSSNNNEDSALQMLDDAIDFDLEEFDDDDDDDDDNNKNTTIESTTEQTFSTTEDNKNMKSNSCITTNGKSKSVMPSSSIEAVIEECKKDYHTSNGEMSDTSSECSDATVVEALDMEISTVADGEDGSPDIDSFLDDQFNFGDDNNNDSDNGDLD